MAAVSTGLLISSRHKSDGVSVYLIITAKRTVIYGSKTSPPHHLNQTSADTIPGQDSQQASGKKPPKNTAVTVRHWWKISRQKNFRKDVQTAASAGKGK